jgi:2-isopropylmalate synthase
LLEANYNVVLPRIQIEFSQIVQKRTDEEGTEITAQEIWKLFKETYVDTKDTHYRLEHYQFV